MKRLFIFLIIIIFLLVLMFLLNKFNNTQENFFKYPNKEEINTCYPNVMSKKEEDILEQLIDIWNEVSNQLDIKWSVCAGSYIGIMRDGGRIPWDDDFDVVIMKKDVEKMKHIDKILSKYNVSISRFWGGYKLFFNDSRAIRKFKQFPWNWPFIDIFALGKDKECSFLEESEFPLKKMKFGSSNVFVYQNPKKDRSCIRNTNWKNELYDNGYRHQLEREIKFKCLSKKKNNNI